MLTSRVFDSRCENQEYRLKLEQWSKQFSVMCFWLYFFFGRFWRHFCP